MFSCLTIWKNKIAGVWRFGWSAIGPMIFNHTTIRSIEVSAKRCGFTFYDLALVVHAALYNPARSYTHAYRSHPCPPPLSTVISIGVRLIFVYSSRSGNWFTISGSGRARATLIFVEYPSRVRCCFNVLSHPRSAHATYRAYGLQRSTERFFPLFFFFTFFVFRHASPLRARTVAPSLSPRITSCAGARSAGIRGWFGRSNLIERLTAKCPYPYPSGRPSDCASLARTNCPRKLSSGSTLENIIQRYLLLGLKLVFYLSNIHVAGLLRMEILRSWAMEIIADWRAVTDRFTNYKFTGIRRSRLRGKIIYHVDNI